MLLNMLKCICKQLEIGERMGKIIAFVNQKGGVGKTTSSINLAASLGLLGKKTLLVDLDPQGNATTGVGIVKSEVKDSVYELLTEKAEVTDVIIKTKFKNLYTVPASINLAGVDMELMEMSRNNKDFIAQLQLKKALETVAEIFDYIILTEELGREFWKPHPKSFEIMLEKFNVEVENVLYVADNPKKDFFIKNALNLKTVRILRDNQIYKDEEYLGGIKEDILISNLNELIDYLN